VIDVTLGDTRECATVISSGNRNTVLGARQGSNFGSGFATDLGPAARVSPPQGEKFTES
jgi:hypothetical protein